MTLLTGQGLIELSQIRPIDNLFMLINEMIKGVPGQKADLIKDFEDFLSSYTIPEVCSMLI